MPLTVVRRYFLSVAVDGPVTRDYQEGARATLMAGALTLTDARRAGADANAQKTPQQMGLGSNRPQLV